MYKNAQTGSFVFNKLQTYFKSIDRKIKKIAPNKIVNNKFIISTLFYPDNPGKPVFKQISRINITGNFFATSSILSKLL